MRALVAMLLLTVALAGCSSSHEPPAEAEGGPTAGDEQDTGNQTLEAVPPLARLNVTASNGTAPLEVNFTLDASGNITAWTFDFGNGNATNGTRLPMTLSATYDAGLWNATLRVMGPGGNTSAIASLHVTDAAAPEITVLEPFQQTVAVDTPCPGCGDGGTLTCLWRTHGQGQAQECAWIDYPDEYIGHPFTLVGNGLDADLLFWEECDAGVGPKFHGDGNEAGVIPDGMGCVLVWEQLDFLIDLTFTITPA